MPPEVNPSSLDFGTLEYDPDVPDGPDGHIGPKVPKSMQVVITNPNNEKVTWDVVITGAPLSLDTKQVTINPHGQETVTVTVEKDSLTSGKHDAILHVDQNHWDTQCKITVTI